MRPRRLALALVAALPLATVVVSCTGAEDEAQHKSPAKATATASARPASATSSGSAARAGESTSVLPDRLAGYKVENPAGKTGGAPAELPDQVGGTTEVRWVTSEKDPEVRVVLTAVELPEGSGAGTGLDSAFSGGARKTLAGQEVAETSDGAQTYLLWRKDATTYIVAAAPAGARGIEDVLAATIQAATG